MKKKLKKKFWKNIWKKIVTNGALLCGAPLLSQIVMAHQWCAISIWYTNGASRRAPLLSDLVMAHLNLGSLWLNLGSICLISSQITLSGQTSRKVTHPHTTPARARLTSQFYPTPAPPHLTGTCWYMYHINPIKPCWCLGLSSCSWVWWNFEKYFKLSGHITYHFLKKKIEKISNCGQTMVKPWSN